MAIVPFKVRTVERYPGTNEYWVVVNPNQVKYIDQAYESLKEERVAGPFKSWHKADNEIREIMRVRDAIPILDELLDDQRKSALKKEADEFGFVEF